MKTPTITHAPPTLDSGATLRHFILGTAGHIDHGKSSLVRALTGTDPDRLPEEKARGMTIELGFAELTVGDIRFGIVDVPGHERFIKTMVSGATGMDLVMLIVAADDSVMPQTIEHVEILRLLGVQRGVVAITKIDMVDPEVVELVKDDIAKLLEDTQLADVEVCPVSSVTGMGLDELKSALARAVDRAAERRASAPFRMAIDRVFTVQGRGTVVTGSVLRGSVQPGDRLQVFPGGHECRVREMQSHGSDQASVSSGQRAALNLTGIDRDQLERGCELATPGYLTESHLLDVRIECLASSDRLLKSSGVVHLCIGTREVPVRVVLLGASMLAPGESAHAQLRCGEPLTSAYGQRFILRDPSASHTIGGGAVLRPVARRRRRDVASLIESLRRLESNHAEDRLEEVLRQVGFAAIDDLQVCARAGIELNGIPAAYAVLKQQHRWVQVAGTQVRATQSTLDDMSTALVSWLRRFHQTHPDAPGRSMDSVVTFLERVSTKSVAKPILESLIQKGTVKRLGGFICLPEFAPALSKVDEKALAIIVDQSRKGGFQPPSHADLIISAQVDQKRLSKLLTLAVALGELVRIDAETYLHREYEPKLRETVAGLIQRQQSVAVSEVREALGSSRKYVVPFMEYLDRVGFTKRIDDRRVLASAAS